VRAATKEFVSGRLCRLAGDQQGEQSFAGSIEPYVA
jgi:hypothetical protein